MQYLNKYLLTGCYVLDTELGVGNWTETKTDWVSDLIVFSFDNC